MSALCLYSCGNYTDEPDGVCIGCKGYSSVKEIIKNIKAEGDEPMATSTHKNCKEEGCTKQCWKEGMCYKHYFQAHPDEPRPGAKTVKKNNPSPPPLTSRGGETVKCRCDSKPTAIPKVSADIEALVARMAAKRDALKFEIIKIDGALLTLKDMCGIEAPEPEFLIEH
jgi:hypothetical protein